jgi:hypothetical protein
VSARTVFAQAGEGAASVLSLVGRVARDGWARIGSPSVFGERNLEALFRAARPQVHMSGGG